MNNVQPVRLTNQTKMNCLNILRFFILLLFFAYLFNLSSAIAEPSISSISGEFSENGIVKITGNNFGAKSPVAPILWDDLESGQPSEDWSLLENGLSVVPSSGLKNSKYSFRLDKGAGDTGVSVRKNYIINDYFYTFVKRRYDYAVKNDNHKFFRIYQTGGNNSSTWNYNWGSSYQMRNSYTPFIDPKQQSPNHFIKLGAENLPSVGQWQTEEFFFKLETAIGAFDGHMGYRLNNNQHRSFASNRKMRDAAHNYPYGQIYIDNYSDRMATGRAKSGDFIWMDSLYMDNTWSRVMVGDNAVYDNCSKKIEIQYPQTWRKDEIKIKFNPGTFSKGEKAYLFVFDSDNQVSNGIGFTIGGSSVNNNVIPRIINISLN